ncbi:MAG: hypothetical protein ACJ8FN_00965, partial [Sphingomicrobium sp.]
LTKECQRGFADMNRGARIFMYFSFAFINFFMFQSPGLKALGVVFVILGIQQLVAKPKVS